MSTPTFVNKRALVTGSASGIGRRITERLIEAGAAVVGTDLRHPEAPVAGCEGFVVADLTTTGGREAVLGSFHRVDLLVNAAGLSITKPMEETTEDDWDQVMAVNGKVPFLMMQAMTDKMSRGGAIVNISSVAGKMAANPQGAPYNASKAAVIALSRTFAYVFAPRGIRVNTVCPGVIRTPMLDGIIAANSELAGVSIDNLEQDYARQVPMGRFGDADEVADTVLYLLSDASSYMTGQDVNVCGGSVMW